MSSLLVHLENINWKFCFIFVGAFAALWAGLSELIPPQTFKVVSIILGALTAMTGFLTKGTKKDV